MLPFSGSPRYAPHGRADVEQQVSGSAMWRRVLRAWPAAARAEARCWSLTHAAPRGLNDAPDQAHRGFAAFRWLLDRLAPPLWLHGHTALVRRGIDARTLRRNGTLLVNVTGATLVELVPPRDRDDDPRAVPVGRYAVLAVWPIAALLVITLLVRPLIFSLADPRDDAQLPAALRVGGGQGPAAARDPC